MTDDNDDPGRKKNTDRDFKPAEGKRIDFSPRGTVGRSPAGLQGPGLGTPLRRQQSFEQAQSLTPEQKTEKDTRPVAIKTGDPDVDRQTEKDGLQLKTLEEIKELAKAEQNTKPDAPAKTGDKFIETDDPEVNAFYQETHDMVSKEEATRQKQQEIAAKFRADKQKDRGHER